MNKKYTTLNDDLKKNFPEKIYKISLDTHFTCPTRDGTKGTKGCFYCGSTGSHFVNTNQIISLKEQIDLAKARIKQNWKNPGKFLAYFQSYTPTYRSIEEIRNNFEIVFSDPEIVACNIATRPDTLDDLKIALLSDFLVKKYHWVELGLESSHDQTLKKVGRGHTYQDFLDAYYKLKTAGLRVVVHLILGLPGETEDMILETIKRLIELKVDGLKLHNLHIVKNSVFANWYKQNKIKLYSYEEYLELLVKILSIIPKEVVIHRLVGDAPKEYLIAPDWVRNKLKFLNDLKNCLNQDLQD